MRISTRTRGFILLLASLLVCHTPLSILGNQAPQGEKKKPVENRTPVRRALLVGINKYNADKPDAQKETGRVETTSANKGVNIGTNRYCPDRGGFGNLDGPVNDVNEMETLLKGKYGFTELNKLIDAEATREGILKAIAKHLITDAAAGDVCLFYYSGHGSRVRDSANGEQKGYDESIIPVDSARGAQDIRDKEIRELFLRAIDQKKIVLTLIFDSCHSGSVARGAATEHTRSAPFCERDAAKEPGYKQPSFKPGEAPETRGALVLSAAQDIEQAQEKIHDGVWRGNFTWALTEVLKQPVITESEPAESLFRRVVSMMRGDRVRELPVMAGNDERRRAPLFGGPPVGGWNMPTANVTKKDGKQVSLEGGLAIGLGEGSVLRKLEPGGKPGNVLVEVTRLVGLNGCEAALIEGDEKTVKAGDPFMIEKWIPRQTALLKVWMPPALNETEVKRLASEVAALRNSGGIKLIDDPTETLTGEIVQFDTSGWRGLGEQGRIENLGSSLDLKGLAARPPAAQSIFINIPPPPGLRQAIKVGNGTPRPAIEVTSRMEDASYILAGRVKGAQVEYAWVRPGATTSDSEKATEPMPAKQGWVSLDWTKESMEKAAEKLEEYAVTLSRVKGWLGIQAPTSEGFPYRLALREKGTTQLIEGDRDASHAVQEVYGSKVYDLLLVADKQDLNRLQNANKLRQQYVYVFGIGSDGCSHLLYPIKESGGVENKLPFDPSQAAAIIELPPGVELAEPFGFDTYIMLATSQPITFPNVLEFCAKDYKDRGTRGGDTPLGQLLLGVGSATRAPKTPTPTDWIMDRMHLRSLPQPR